MYGKANRLSLHTRHLVPGLSFQSSHQPPRLTLPATILQDDGAAKSLQLEQECPSFGEFWYLTEACDTCAASAVMHTKAALGAATATDNKSLRRLMLLKSKLLTTNAPLH